MNLIPPLPIVGPLPPGAFVPILHAVGPNTRPLVQHKISAGFPSPAADYVEKGLDLNTFMVQHKEASFFFTVVGESMSGIGIMDGDIVLVDRSVTPVHGHYVLAVIDGEYTLKRLHMRQGVIELHPENGAFAPIRLIDGQELQIWGVVAGVVRKYRV
jgi:DNA polymerase V